MDLQFEEDLFEQTGQYEPITTRIRTILREYKDGVGIFKELIQNADDAGAAKVKFLVDWRHGGTGSLFSPGMAECQGPALWAYNDALFTDEDFENINKLAGETKVEDVSKIGRFGLGFNAVYHLTDVPSFISREHLIVFDPNTHHLQRHIQNRSRPGIRINLVEKPESLTRYQDQFQPYNGVFGCNTTETCEDFYYNGTLFRFPFRTTAQARTSDIIKTPYGRDRIQAIVCNLRECASNLLIFCQHIKEVEVYELDESSQLNKIQLVLSINKESKPTARASGQLEVNREPFIVECSKWWKQCRESPNSSIEFPSDCEIVKIRVTEEESELSGCDRRSSSDQTWLVVSASGKNASLKIASSPEGRARGFLPCGGAAFVVQRSYEHDSNSDFSGELFCFLPLSIPTGLPVHVNGYFAIMSNRVEIWKRSIMRNQPIEVEWNEALMRDALARAYIMLLQSMRDWNGKVQDYKFYSLWPSIDTVDMKSWEKLVLKIYHVLLDPQSKLFFSDGIWMSINDGLILSDEFTGINDEAGEVLRLLKKSVFNVPPHVLQTLIKFDRWRILERRTLTFTKFMEEAFIPNIKTLSTTLRDTIVCFGLDRIMKNNKSFLSSGTQEINFFKQHACISVSQEEGILSKPSQLIHPFGSAAELFSVQDHRFPVGDDLREVTRLHVLEKLGMVKDLHWSGIYERAQYVATTGDLKRCRELIAYINKRIDHLPKPVQYRSAFHQVEFLPVLKKPTGNYHLPWKGSSGLAFCSPSDAFLPKDAKLVGSSCVIVDTSDDSGCGKMNAKVKHFFGFSSRLPEDRFVLQQLDEANKFWTQLNNEGRQNVRMMSAIESVCLSIYKFFNTRTLKDAGNLSFLNELRNRKWLFLQGNFVESKKVAYTSSENAAPFLFTLPSNYSKECSNLFEAMQIKRTFDDGDYITALYELENMKHGSALTGNELQTAIFLITQINVKNPAVKEYIGKIPLPDTDSIFRPSKDVVVNLSLLLEDSGDTLKVHERIPPQRALALGAKSLKNVMLKKYSRRIGYGESFGQHEELTERLKGILDGYPADGILKELVQNADDAQASEIHFIHDTRILDCKKVVTEGETSKEIQGPALCVYNNKPFTEKDLDGIKNLGIGSKRDTPGMTGKYGIGFNSVYHLTDCPSFLSNDDTLVFLDPHSRYFDVNDRGQIFKSMDARFREINSDTLDGYLADHFELQGSTMFRFPLRRKNNESKISEVPPDMETLLLSFQNEARKSLLFLNNIKKITLSKIGPSARLQEIFCVECVITPEGERKRQELARKVGEIKNIPTAEIEWDGVNYTIGINQNKKKVEKWLIQRCVGSVFSTSPPENRNEIPDGRKLGLLPRGDVAARLWIHPSFVQKRPDPEFRGIAYCFLPLPQNTTNLPVHINGHFALDSTRRGLWTDTDGKGVKCDWNRFMKSSVLSRAYADLIIEARNHLCDDDNQFSRYHELFPRIVSDSPWEALTIELYRYLGRTKANVLPLLVLAETGNEPITSSGESITTYTSITATRRLHQPTRFTCAKWIPADQAYFRRSNSRNDFAYLLIRIGLPVLLHAPYRIYDDFRSVGITSHKVNPSSVIGFLREFNSTGSSCKIGSLPQKLQTTVVNSISDLLALIEYCCKDENFSKHLEGLPLLLTQDGHLRMFETRQPVFRSTFGDLFPTRSHLFIHSDIVHEIPSDATVSEEKIVHHFTEKDLAQLLPQVFTDKTLWAIKNNPKWKFPDKGILSEQWFKRFWDFLQNYTNPEQGKDSVSLDCLSKWPIIPTTCAKLVTIEDAKSVLDMTILGYESSQQENVRTLLSNLECPILNKEITLQEGKSSRAGNVNAITGTYVAHPHNVRDVLGVLQHMSKKNRIDVSKVCEDSILEFLRFVQDDYKRSGSLEVCKEIIKALPFHKAMDGQFVSLIGNYSSYALVPSGVPTQQLSELQNQAKCLFLNSDALFNLEKLYRDLGVRGGQNVTQFYVKYVFKYFMIFTRESQMKHLQYIKDKIFPSFPQGGSYEKSIFLMSFKETPCIPNENGRLHVAADFFDPSNEVFKVMFADDLYKFPPAPFNDESWLQLLRDVGLQEEVTPQLFLQFCRTVSEKGKILSTIQQSCAQSKELVKCLFSTTALQGHNFLYEVSQVKFITAAKVEEELTSIHEQYQCQRNNYPPFIEFCNAVPWDLRFTSWSTVPILPDWAQLNDMVILKDLGVACSGPQYNKVLDHLQNVVNSSCIESVDHELLKEITKSIYQFLSGATKCSSRSPDVKCSYVCIDIGARLKSSSCIYLPEDKTFVAAKQLVVKPPDKFPFKPFLFPVPENFGELQHFLKRLGATDRPTPLQIAYFLRSIHEQIGEKVLSGEEEKKVKYAMRMIFYLLYKGESAVGIDELYLPSQGKLLVKSSEMVCNVSPRFTEVIKKLQRPILIRFEECGLKKVADAYIDALPESLTPVKFDEILREEVAPECKRSVCPEAHDGSTCKFQEQFQNLLQSDDFQEGIKRLLMHDRQNPQEFEQKIKALQTDVTTKCAGFESIKINIIHRDSKEVLDSLVDICYAVQEKDTWTLYLQHEFKDDRRLLSAASCINKILGDCIKKEMGIIAMLSCSSPCEISSELDKLDITYSSSNGADNVDDSDDEIFSDLEIDDDDAGEKYDSKRGHGSRGGGGIGSRRRGKKSDGRHSGKSYGCQEEDDRFFPKSNEEAMRWLRQSKNDLDGAKWLLQSGPPFSAHACFHCHQVVEKCLKAMLFNRCGVSGGLLASHEVADLANQLREETGLLDERVMESVRGLANYYLNTRYPNRQPRAIVPFEAFNENQAEAAVDAASKVYELVSKHWLRE